MKQKTKQKKHMQKSQGDVPRDNLRANILKIIWLALWFNYFV